MLNLHATCVAWQNAGVLIVGASGAGKSSLALHLLALGAVLISDDRTEITQKNDVLTARCPAPIQGFIEARGVGILKATVQNTAPVRLVINLDRIERDRMPRQHWYEINGVRLPCLYKVEASHFPSAILQYLKAGRKEPE
ncbi:MAG: HPr kinase/phosphorylase [Roseobacter sp.]